MKTNLLLSLHEKALKTIEAAMPVVVLHVYDEILVECATKDAKKTAALIADVMRRAPAWAPEMKLEVEQKISRRWGK